MPNCRKSVSSPEAGASSQAQGRAPASASTREQLSRRRLESELPPAKRFDGAFHAAGERRAPRDSHVDGQRGRRFQTFCRLRLLHLSRCAWGSESWANQHHPPSRDQLYRRFGGEWRALLLRCAGHQCRRRYQRHLKPGTCADSTHRIEQIADLRSLTTALPRAGGELAAFEPYVDGGRGGVAPESDRMRNPDSPSGVSFTQGAPKRTSEGILVRLLTTGVQFRLPVNCTCFWAYLTACVQEKKHRKHRRVEPWIDQLGCT
jgi:hypothetical protein